MQQVSVIIVNYNTARLVVDAVGSLLTHTYGVELDVIVVDNNSKDDCQKLLTERFGDKVRYIGLSENIGFGRANNVGIEAVDAMSSYLFLLNPDTLLVNNAVKILVDYMELHPYVGAVGGNLYDGQMKPAFSYFRYRPSIWTVELKFLTFGVPFMMMNNLTHNYLGRPIEVGFLSGAGMMLRRLVIEEVGGFDPDFFMYCEDVELCHRVRQAGYQVRSVPDAKVIHLEGQSFDFKHQRAEMTLNSHQILLRKTRTNTYIWLANKVFMIGVLFRIFVYSVMGKRLRKERTLYYYKAFKRAVLMNKKVEKQ